MTLLRGHNFKIKQDGQGACEREKSERQSIHKEPVLS
jgi:hypothetical protein